LGSDIFFLYLFSKYRKKTARQSRILFVQKTTLDKVLYNLRVVFAQITKLEMFFFLAKTQSSNSIFKKNSLKIQKKNFPLYIFF